MNVKNKVLASLLFAGSLNGYAMEENALQPLAGNDAVVQRVMELSLQEYRNRPIDPLQPAYTDEQEEAMLREALRISRETAPAPYEDWYYRLFALNEANVGFALPPVEDRISHAWTDTPFGFKEDEPDQHWEPGSAPPLAMPAAAMAEPLEESFSSGSFLSRPGVTDEILRQASLAVTDHYREIESSIEDYPAIEAELHNLERGVPSLDARDARVSEEDLKAWDEQRLARIQHLLRLKAAYARQIEAKKEKVDWVGLVCSKVPGLAPEQARKILQDMELIR